jgi:hypothetical protein
MRRRKCQSSCRHKAVVFSVQVLYLKRTTLLQCLSWHQGWHMCLRPRQSSDLMLHFISISTIHPVFRLLRRRYQRRMLSAQGEHAGGRRRTGRRGAAATSRRRRQVEEEKEEKGLRRILTST